MALRLALVAAIVMASEMQAQSPGCSSGPSRTASEPYSWVEPHPTELVAEQVGRSLMGLGYRFARVTPARDSFVTEPSFVWPADPTLSQWRGLVYPGAWLRVALEPVGPWTRVHLETHLVCHTGQRPPPSHPQEVDFDVFVLERIKTEAHGAISSPLARIKVRTLAPSCAPLNDGDQAIDLCRRIAKARPNDADAQRDYALALARFYRADQAWKPLRRVFALEGERRETYLEIGEAMFRTGKFAGARKLYSRGVALWPRDPIMVYRLGRAYLGEQQFRKAADQFVAALQLDASLIEAHWYAAVALAGAKRLDASDRHCQAAVPLLEAALPARANDVDLWLGLAYCAARSGRHREAVAYYGRAEKLDFSAAQRAPAVVAEVRKSVQAISGRATSR